MAKYYINKFKINSSRQLEKTQELGDKFTNTNLLILEQAIGGYDAVGITSGATLTFSNGVLSKW